MENFAKFLAVLLVAPIILLGFFLVMSVFIDLGDVFPIGGERQPASVVTSSEENQSEIGRPAVSGSAGERNEYTVTVKDMKFTVEVADTPETRRQGLSNRDSLPSNHGLLFIFDDSDRHGIWMKDMRFAIDIIWLNSEKRAVDIEKHVSPETYPETFYPRKEALYVIEVPAGFVERNNIREGDFFVFTTLPPGR